MLLKHVHELYYFFLQNPSHHIMGDLLEYFEAQSRNLDEMSASWSSPIPANFTSVIKFNGVPILPPVVIIIELFTPMKRNPLYSTPRLSNLHLKVTYIRAFSWKQKLTRHC